MKKALWCTIAVLLVLYGLAVTAAAQCWFGLSLKKELDPVSLASLSVTIFIAFFLQYFFASRATDLRVEKDFLIENQKEALKAAKACRAAVDSSFYARKITGQSKQQILFTIRELANCLDVLEEALHESHCRSLASDFLNAKNFYYQLKSAATGGSFPTQPYSTAVMDNVEKNYRGLRKKLQQLFFKVNRFH
jgi:hypothetical protein